MALGDDPAGQDANRNPDQRYRQRQRQGEGQRSALVIAWDDACLKWIETIAELNRQINNFNLKRPSDKLEMFKLNLDKELERAGARRYLQQL